MIDLTNFKPQLAGTGNIDYFLFNNDVVAVEPKVDGVRCILHKKGDKINLYSRSGQDWTKRYADFIPLIKDCFLSDEMILDGELAVIDNGSFTTSSTALKKELSPTQKRVYFAFDILQINQESLIELPLMQRKDHLHLLTQNNAHFSIIPHHCVNNKDDLLEFYRKCIKKFEGIVVKNLKPYYQNSRFNWLKLKPVNTLDLKVIKKELTSDGKMNLYTLEGEGVLLNRVISAFKAEVGEIVEVCYEMCAPSGPIKRIKFPKILRVREKDEKNLMD